MNKKEYLNAHRKAYLKDKDTCKHEIDKYIDFISALYEYGMELNCPMIGIDLYHGDYTIFEIGMGN